MADPHTWFVVNAPIDADPWRDVSVAHWHLGGGEADYASGRIFSEGSDL